MALRPEVILLDAPLTGLDPTDSNSWIEILDRLAEGHPAMGGKPATLVATAHDFRPWRGHARQFAALRQKHLRLLRHEHGYRRASHERNGGQRSRLMALQDLTPQLRTRLSRLERVVGIFVVVATLLLLAGLGLLRLFHGGEQGLVQAETSVFYFRAQRHGAAGRRPHSAHGFSCGPYHRDPTTGTSSRINLAMSLCSSKSWSRMRATFGRIQLRRWSRRIFWEDVTSRSRRDEFSPDIHFRSYEDVTLAEARDRTEGTYVFSQEVWDDTITNYVVRAGNNVTTAVLDRLAAMGVSTIQIADQSKRTTKATGIWDEKAGKSTRIEREKKKRCWVHVDETPAVTDRLQKITNQVEAALPNFLGLTNTLVRVLTNVESVVRNTDQLLVSARPVVTNFANQRRISADRRGRLGTGSFRRT